ncbi:MAG: FkbM family methyltransferase [Crocinitomicaceae bacterium]|nr:FkbM family methyltransferase [Crocinitomicaceae bacterium]
MVRIQRGPLKGFLWLLSISDSRYILGTYEEGQTDLILKEMKSSKSFADFGANSGYYSLMVKKMYSNAEVFMFEPLPKNIQIIENHFKANFSEQNYHLDPCAVGNMNGTIEFTDSGNDSANTYKKESSMHEFGEKIEVQITKLDDLAEKYNWDSSIFMKVDIEGAEEDFLQGGLNFLRKFKPKMILATHDTHVPGVEKACLDIATDLGYQFEVINDDKIKGQVDYLLF